MPKTTFHKNCELLASIAHREYCRNIHRQLYLYAKPDKHGRVYTELELLDDYREDWQLAICEHVPRDRTEQALKVWFIDKLRRSPVLDAKVVDGESFTLTRESATGRKPARFENQEKTKQPKLFAGSHTDLPGQQNLPMGGAK